MQAKVVLIAAALVLVAACKKPEGGTSESQAAPTATSSTAAGGGEEEAKDLFKTRCVPCHGDQGKGNGPGAAALNPKPRNYTDATWQASVTDEQLKKTIVGGGAAVGKSPNMPANPDLEGKDAELNGLVAIIRGFKGK